VKTRSRAFVLGGGAQGALQVGALRALLEAGLQPDLMVGTSVGAINATYLAVHGATLASLDGLIQAWHDAAAARLSDGRGHCKTDLRGMSIVILVASSGMGKTTACRRAVKLAKAAGFRAAGLLSVPLYRNGAKDAIVLYEVHGHSWRTLARAHGESQGPQVGIWVFEQRALAWGQQVLASLPACDLLVIDEIGPLEIEQGLGLTNAFDVLRRPGYRLALVSLRPSLAEALARRLGGMTIAVQALDEMNRDSLPKALVQKLKEAPSPMAGERRRNGDGKRGP